ncbi:MAG: glycoside hydrolase family 15 protein [Steroidobacteraceae bacterium]
MKPLASPIEFLPVEQHGAIGDRRTGAMVGADGTIDWFCAPDFDSPPLFGALLDCVDGGFCRVGAAQPAVGRQRYQDEGAVLTTAWPEHGLEVADVMAWPGDDRPADFEDCRVILRRLRAIGNTEVHFEFRPRRDFQPLSICSSAPASAGIVFRAGGAVIGCWTSFASEWQQDRAFARLALRAGDEHWVVLGWNSLSQQWNPGRARSEFIRAQQYWLKWCRELHVKDIGSRTALIRRSAVTVQLLSHARRDCTVAALTNSLPERIGGNRNYDYRYCWIRDGSLSLALLARLGKAAEVQRYLHWLCARRSRTASPLQVCYRVDGDTDLDQRALDGVSGYRDSRPVHVGNRAARQRQQGSLGFFADCARIYFDEGGQWCPQFWQLLQRVADYTCAHWRQPDSGLWELAQEAQYVASRVMSWVVLDRAIHIAQRTGQAQPIERWQRAAREIHDEVMREGWSERRGSFRQRYGSDALDGALLLIPLMGFLPVDHPRVRSTLKSLEGALVVNGLMHRFDPQQTLAHEDLPMAQFEGAFMPCVFWHAHVLAKAGRCQEAELILQRCETVAGDTALFAEEMDTAHNRFLGNSPLLFSHVEYVRAVSELASAGARES